MAGLILIFLGCILYYNKDKILDYQEKIAGRNNQAFKREVREVVMIIWSISSVLGGIVLTLLKFV